MIVEPVRARTRVLLALYAAPATSHQLCDALDIPRGSMPALLGELQRRGLAQHGQDRPVIWSLVRPAAERELERIGRTS